MKTLLVTLLLLFGPITSHSKVIQDDEIWASFNSFIRLNDKWLGFLEYQQLFLDYSRYNGVQVYRGAVGRVIGKDLSAWMGYAMLNFNERSNSKFPSKPIHEDRPFLQLLKNADHNKWRITNRARYEFRQFRYDDSVGQRLRYFLRAQYKLNGSNWAFAAWDEYFYNMNTINPSQESHAPTLKAGFNLNLAFIGFAYFFGNEHQHMIETGYLNNYTNGATADRNANAWMTTVSGQF